MTVNEIVVVGAGYAGVLAANRLALGLRDRARVTVVNPADRFVQRLRLHQHATGQQIAAPRLSALLAPGVTLLRSWVTAVDPQAGRVGIARNGHHAWLPFDRLVLATGSSTDLTALPGLAENALAVGDRQAADRLRPALQALPAGARVLVAGGGLTGLETVAEIAGSRPDLSVGLVTDGIGDDHLTARGGRHIDLGLERLGIDVVTGARIREVDHDRLVLADGTELPADLIIWCGGFVCSPIAARAGLAVDQRGAVITDPGCRSVSHPQVLAAGDAGLPPLPYGATYQMTCQSGIPAGDHAARVIIDELRGREPQPFRFRYVHRHVSLGRKDGLVQFTDRHDHPNGAILTGRAALAYKEAIIRATLPWLGFGGAVARLRRPAEGRRWSEPVGSMR